MTPLRMSNILNDADINTIFSNMQLLLGVNMYVRAVTTINRAVHARDHNDGFDWRAHACREFNQNLSKKVSELSTPSANIPIGDVFAKLVLCSSFVFVFSILLAADQ